MTRLQIVCENLLLNKCIAALPGAAKLVCVRHTSPRAVMEVDVPPELWFSDRSDATILFEDVGLSRVSRIVPLPLGT